MPGMSRLAPAEIWLRRPGESNRAFAQFTLYLELGKNRSVAQVSRQCRKNVSHLYRISRRFEWEKRCDAWDQHVIEMRQEKYLEQNLEMSSRHATIACLLQERLVTRIQGLTEQEVAELTPEQIISWFRISVEVERVSRGQPTQILQPAKKDDEEDDEGPPEPVEFQETIISTRQDFETFKKNLRPDQKLLTPP
jgi:hypothetical protein